MYSFLIDLSDAKLYYAAFYAASFLASFVILLVEGRRRNIAQLPWLIVIATGFISFVIGCRLVTLSADDWRLIISNQPLDHSTGLVMLGGLLFCVPFILLTKRLVGLGESVLDAYALVLPVGMCLQRIGCFLNGCCFGSITSGFGVHYGQGTPAFFNHYNESIISEASVTSLSVHPVQLYESLGCVIVLIFILCVRGKLKAQGSLFYLSGLLYYCIRFFTEFFRDIDAHAMDLPVWYSLNAVQWLMLILISGSIIIVTLKERTPRAATIPDIQNFKGIHIVYFFALSVFFLIASKWLRPAEIFVVYVVLFTTAIYLLVELFKLVTMPGFRVASLTLILLALVMMSQTYPEQATSDETLISYNTISVGGLAGMQDLTSISEGCGNYTENEFKNRYQLMALGFSRTVQTGAERSYTFGLSSFLGTHDEEVTGSITGDRPELTTYGFTPYIQADYRAIGIGAGLHLGDMSFISHDPTVTSIQRYSAYPQLYVRFGRINRFFGELSFARSFPGSFPGNTLQANLGWAVNSSARNPGVMRIGSSSSTGVFIAANIPIGNNFVIEPYVGFLGSPFMTFTGYDENTGTLGSLSLHYKFSRHERNQANAKP